MAFCDISRWKTACEKRGGVGRRVAGRVAGRVGLCKLQVALLAIWTAR